MLDTEEEMNFIHQNQRNFSDNYEYTIGGETTVVPQGWSNPEFFEYNDYIPELGDENRWYYGHDGEP